MLHYVICKECGAEMKNHPPRCGGACAGCGDAIDMNSHLIVGSNRFCDATCWQNYDEAMQARQEEAIAASRAIWPGQPFKFF